MIRLFALLAAAISVQGCVVAKVADAAVSTGATAVKTTAKVGAGAVDAVTPDPKDDEDKDRDDNQ
ncbi:MAG: NF038104 family lipoprotein [Pseudomonadota bacterium]